MFYTCAHTRNLFIYLFVEGKVVVLQTQVQSPKNGIGLDTASILLVDSALQIFLYSTSCEFFRHVAIHALNFQAHNSYTIHINLTFINLFIEVFYDFECMFCVSQIRI